MKNIQMNYKFSAINAIKDIDIYKDAQVTMT